MRYTGTIVVPSRGVDVDATPPGYRFRDNDLSFNGGDLHAGGSAKIMRWEDGARPSREQCRAGVDGLSPDRSAALPDVSAGTRFCLPTAGDHTPPEYAFGKVESVEAQTLTVSIAVWSDPVPGPPSTPDPGVFFTGQATVKANGVDLDSLPPRYEFRRNDLMTTTNGLRATNDVKIAAWDSGTPDRQGCRKLLDGLAPEKAAILLNPRAGLGFCVRTGGDATVPKYAFGIVGAVTSEGYDVTFTVWDNPA